MLTQQHIDQAKAAIKRIERKEDWCTGAFGRDRRGKPIDAWDPDCVQVCMVGAIGVKCTYHDDHPFVLALFKQIPESDHRKASESFGPAFGAIPYYNDTYGHEAILELARKAVSAMEHELAQQRAAVGVRKLLAEASASPAATAEPAAAEEVA